MGDCLPLIGFLPGSRTVLVENPGDFREQVLRAREQGFVERAEPERLRAAGILDWSGPASAWSDAVAAALPAAPRRDAATRPPATLGQS